MSRVYKYNDLTGKLYFFAPRQCHFGYTLDNSVVCCRRCNCSKREWFTYDEWHDMTECFRDGRRKI